MLAGTLRDLLHRSASPHRPATVGSAFRPACIRPLGLSPRRRAPYRLCSSGSAFLPGSVGQFDYRGDPAPRVPDDVIREAASLNSPFDFRLAARGERFVPLFSVFGQRLHFELSPEEVVQFLDGVKAAKHHAILTTCYAAGLRISEAVHLTVSAIDSERMVLRIAKGKGQKDRYVMLSPKLLAILRTWWKVDRPRHWLFPGERPETPITRGAVQRACQIAARRARLAKAVSPHSLRNAST